MRRQTNKPKGAPGGAAERPSGQEKRPYRSPRLVVYGDLRRIAMAKQGVTADGGAAPPTRM